MRNITFGTILAAVLVACGGPAPVAPATPVSHSRSSALVAIEVVSGDGQTAIVGTDLPLPLVARVTDADTGLPVQGQVVNFRVVSGEGAVFAGAAATDENGIAKERWTLGGVPGPQRVECRAVDSDTGAPIVYATFNATAIVDPALTGGSTPSDPPATPPAMPPESPPTAPTAPPSIPAPTPPEGSPVVGSVWTAPTVSSHPVVRVTQVVQDANLDPDLGWIVWVEYITVNGSSDHLPAPGWNTLAMFNEFWKPVPVP